MSGTVEALIRARLKANFAQTGRRIRDPNENFDPVGQPWVELRFPGSRTERADIGDASNPMWHEVGAFMVDTYAPRGRGTKLCGDMADEVWVIFAGEKIEGIRCDTRLQGTSGPRSPEGIAGAWWGCTFGIAYRYLHFIS